MKIIIYSSFLCIFNEKSTKTTLFLKEILHSISIDPLSVEGCLVSMFCGLVIGWERQWWGKPAGIRTSIFVCMAAYTFVTLADYYFPGEGSMRVLGQIVSGIGFLGAGLILTKDGLVEGVTSAAIIWVLAAIGGLIGFGNYNAAIFITVLTLIVLLGISWVERIFRKLRRGVHKINKKARKNSES